MRGLTLATALLGATALMGMATPSAQAQKAYEGVEINLLTRPGPVIAGRLEERGKEYEEMTGAKVNRRQGQRLQRPLRRLVPETPDRLGDRD